jgi:CNT family concentrative nucleoside transporter
MSALGLLAFIGLAWCLSENRGKTNWRLVAIGLVLQFGIGVLLLKTDLQKPLFSGMNSLVTVLNNAVSEGANLLFNAENVQLAPAFAFQVLPVIIFVSALAAVLHHLRIIQALVLGVSWVMRRTLKTSGAETVGAALLIFIGIEAVAAIRSYLGKMTRSELFAVMTTFMATIAGSVMVVYVSFGAEAGHLLAASLMSAPAALIVAKVMVPETETPETGGDHHVRIEVESKNVVDAAARGTTQGLYMALNVGAMLIVFIGMVFLINLTLTSIPIPFVGRNLPGLEEIMGYVFYPFAFLMGVPSEDVGQVAQLLGKKTVINEFLAYLDLSALIQEAKLQPRSVTIATYALCGFANPGSIGIMLAGLDTLIPERRAEISVLSIKAFVAGTIACFMTACVAGILVHA